MGVYKMTDITLAEKAAKFLGADIGVSSKWPDTYTLVYEGGSIDFEADDLFDSMHHAPILAHLAKREMEKRGFKMDHSSREDGHSISFWCGPVTKHKNEYKALWLAIEKTGVLDA